MPLKQSIYLTIFSLNYLFIYVFISISSIFMFFYLYLCIYLFVKSRYLFIALLSPFPHHHNNCLTSSPPFPFYLIAQAISFTCFSGSSLCRTNSFSAQIHLIVTVQREHDIRTNNSKVPILWNLFYPL